MKTCSVLPCSTSTTSTTIIFPGVCSTSTTSTTIIFSGVWWWSIQFCHVLHLLLVLLLYFQEYVLHLLLVLLLYFQEYDDDLFSFAMFYIYFALVLFELFLHSFAEKMTRAGYYVLGHVSFFNLSFQPVLHDWCNKGCGMCNPVCGMVHIK